MTIEEKIPADTKSAKSANAGGGVLSDPPVIANLAVNGRVKKADFDRKIVDVELSGLNNSASGTATLERVNPDGSVTPLESKNLEGANVPLMYELKITDIPELTSPEDPTSYSFRFAVYDDDGNSDHSTAPTPLLARYLSPYATKVPSSRGIVPAVAYMNAPADGILNLAWFNTNSGGLRCKPDSNYAFRHAQDIHNFYLNTRALPSSSQTPIFSGPLNASGEFVLGVDALRALGNVSLYQVTNIIDVAGFRSVDSIPKKDLTIQLPPPIVFFPPEVPEAGTDGTTVLTMQNFNPVVNGVSKTVKVNLPRPTNGAMGAIIEVKLESEVLGSKPLGASGGLEFDMTYDAYAAAIGTSTVEFAAKITYTYKEASAAAQDSQQVTTVYLNNKRPEIGLLPEPDLESENLPPVEVTGDTDTLDHLVPGDFGKPITFTFRMWEMDVGDPLSGTATVGFYYNDEFMGDTTIEPTDTEVSIKVDFARVSVHGTGTKLAYCDIRYLDVDATVKQKTPTDVKFEANEVKLQEHTARTFNTDKVVSCPSFDSVGGQLLWRVAVPQGQSSLPPSQSITLHAVGYDDLAMTIPIGTPHSETKQVVAGVQTIFDINFTYLKTLQGPIVPFPGNPNFNYVYVWYETTIAGSLYKSPEVLHRVNVRNTSSKFCDGSD